MNKSESIKNLAIALGKAQAEMPVAIFDEVNAFLKNKYATLGKVIETATPIMGKNGLSYSQLTTGSGGEIGVETILMHESGEWISSTATLPIEAEKGKSKAQVAGSNISYLRRYALASILGIYSDEDNDGNNVGTANRTTNRPAPATTRQPAREPQTQTSEKPTMTIEDAWKVTTSRGTKYGDMPINGLKKMISNLYKNLHSDNPVIDKEVIKTKLQAATIVLKEKESGGAR